MDFKALTPMIEASGAEFVTHGVESAAGRFCISSFNWRRFSALAALFCGPPLPEIVAGPMRCSRGRRAYSLHYLGDDVRYRKREGVALDAERSPTLENGDLADSAEFPLVRASGRGIRGTDGCRPAFFGPLSSHY